MLIVDHSRLVKFVTNSRVQSFTLSNEASNDKVNDWALKLVSDFTSLLRSTINPMIEDP